MKRAQKFKRRHCDVCECQFAIVGSRRFTCSPECSKIRERESARLRSKTHRDSNPEKSREYARKHYRKNPQAACDYQRRYRESVKQDPEKLRKIREQKREAFRVRYAKQKAALKLIERIEQQGLDALL